MPTRAVWPALLIVIGVVAITGFSLEPAPGAQAERITLSGLATRVAVLEETNIDLAARVAELERVVDLLAAAPAATPTQAGGFGPLRTPTAETPTPPATPIALPTDTPAATPVPSASPTPVQGDLVIDGIAVEWGPLLEMFTVSNVRIETRRIRLEQGGSFDAEVLAFDVRANATFAIAILQANLLDAEGFDVTLPLLVEFDPDYNATEWTRGVRSSVQIMLPDPEKLATVKTIRIERMSIGGF